MVCAGINPPARKQLAEHLKRERGVDLNTLLEDMIDVVGVGPRYVGPPLPPRQDIWGVVRKEMSYGEGSYDEIEHYPLAGADSLDDIVNHHWPTTDLFDYSVVPERINAIQKVRSRSIMVANGNIFESSWYMRGFENMFMDFMLNPELANAIFERVCRFYVDHFRRMLEAARGEIDLVFTADDIGGQNGLLMSLELWEAFIKPYHVRLNQMIHEHGAKVIYHTDGGVMEAVDGLIDMGVDVLQALQFDAAGMGPQRLKDQHGDRLCFEGGLSVQRTLPFGNADEVREETEMLIRTLGKNGGYILGPSHAIQAGTPPENILAMLDTARDFYPFS